MHAFFLMIFVCYVIIVTYRIKFSDNISKYFKILKRLYSKKRCDFLFWILRLIRDDYSIINNNNINNNNNNN
jgi:hypothetical protein